MILLDVFVIFIQVIAKLYSYYNFVYLFFYLQIFEYYLNSEVNLM